jgi:ATP-dependent RNA helicase DeaD
MGAGKIGGIGPGDLVGAITHEAGITGAQIGAINITDRFSVVEIPEPLVDRVVHAMRKLRLNGRKVAVRRFVEK